MKLDNFTLAYIECALWCGVEEDGNLAGADDGTAIDISNIAPDTLAQMVADCAEFQKAHSKLFTLANCKRAYEGSASEQAGHDFWLTRNGHGAGFWDGDWEEPAASVLDKAARAFGECGLYVGDDGQIWGC